MGYYDSIEHVEQYCSMADGYDGRNLIDRLKVYLPAGSSVLELGMGPGTDLDMLRQSYEAVGSDTSILFLERYRETQPDAALLQLDAVTLRTDLKFDAVYTNKVMHHLDYSQMKASFQRQIEILDGSGIMMHSFWYGEQIERFEGLSFYQVTEEILSQLLPPGIEIIELQRYTEMDEQDSLYMIGSTGPRQPVITAVR